MRSQRDFARLGNFAAAAAIVLVGLSAVRAETPLRWKFKPGETLNYVLERSAEGKMKLGTSELGLKSGLTFDTTWKVASVDADGTANVEQTVDRIQVSMSSPLTGAVNYDSSVDAPGTGAVWTLLGPLVNGMLGQTFKMRISPLGAVSDIQLPEKLIANFAEQKVGQNRQTGMGIGANPFSEKGIKDLLTKTVLVLPEKADKDVTWTQSFANELPKLGTETSETTYSLAGDETLDGKKLVKISATTELMFEPVEVPLAELEITEQEAKADFYFDADLGRLIKSSGSERAVKELSGQQEVTQDITETVKMHLGKSGPAKKPEPAKGAAKK